MEHLPSDDALGSEPDELLVHYLAKECTSAEALRIEAWTHESTANRDLFEAAQLAWDCSGSTSDLDPSKFTARIRAAVLQMTDRRIDELRTGLNQGSDGEVASLTVPGALPVPIAVDGTREKSVSGKQILWTTPQKVGVFSRQTLQGWALSAVGAVFFALIAVLLVRHPKRDLGTTRTYTTVIGQRASLLLDDGTRVMMAPQTTLRLVRFGQSSRTVVLDGDAYFDVAPSTRAPFIVRSGTSITRVLGTAFEVRHYQNDEEIHVAVVSGKVLVSGGQHRPAVPVTAGHVLSITDSTQIVKAVENIDSEIGWLGDRLLFQDASVAKVLATLTRWYGYEFRYTDSAVVRQNVTIGLSMRSSTEALATLEQILDVSLTVVGDTVTLAPMRGHVTPNQRAKHYDVWVPTREVGR